jgi:hypothetical protein
MRRCASQAIRISEAAFWPKFIRERHITFE